MISRSVRRRIQISRALVRSWRPTGAKLVGLLRSILTSFIALGVTLFVIPGRQSSGPLAVLLLVVVVAAVGTLLRPLLLGLTVLLGSFGLLLAGVLAQASILAIAVSIAPDVHISTFSRIIAVSWLAATIAAVVNWLLDAGSQDAYLGQVLGRVVRIVHRADPDDDRAAEPGLVIVQLDGVGQALLRQAVVAGAVPTVSRWLRTGSHRGYRWHTGLPATTPAGQAVLLHGDRHAVPSFRWYDKGSGRVMVANHPADAQLIEQGLSTGRGLLADGGVSVSNLFSGDAPTRILTMSDAKLPSRTTRGLASFATTSLGFVRTLVVFGGQVIQELYQARRQRRRDVRPRVNRGALFALQRSVTAALLHDLNVAIVAEQMARSAPVIFVDFVDYDEVAHHAGPTRPESIRTLDSLDRVLGFLEDVAAETVRRYEIVVVSDHGQSQGEPFAQLTGQGLDDLVTALATGAGAGTTDRSGAGDGPSDDRAERWGPLNLLLTSAARSRILGIGYLVRRWARRAGTDEDDPAVTLGARTDGGGGRGGAVDGSADAPLTVAAGSLAHIYLPAVPGRATREQIDAAYPGLIAGLVAHPGIGLALVRSAAGLVAIGRHGWRELHGCDGAGADPLVPFGPLARRDLLELDERAHVGDLVVLGRFDPETGEVAAFEELVGSHGGLGGDQTAAVLLVPSSWPAITSERGVGPDEAGLLPALTGADVHRALVDRLAALGLRTGAEQHDAQMTVSS